MFCSHQYELYLSIERFVDNELDTIKVFNLYHCTKCGKIKEEH